MIDRKTVENARNADLVSFFENRYGFSFTQKGGAYRCEQHKSLAIKENRLSWYWHSKGMGGHGVIDYLMSVEQLNFVKAIEAIVSLAPRQAPPSQKAEVAKTLILPEKAGIPLRLYEYLCTKRGIDGEIVNWLIQKEKLYQDVRGNLVFVGFGQQGKPGFASLRGTQGQQAFRMDCAGSDKRYAFAIDFAGFERLYIFESPIDAMSHASLENAYSQNKIAWKQHSRISLAGTSDTALPFFLNQRPDINTLIFCLDNDSAGREATAAMAKKYASKGYTVKIEQPKHKDFNDDLLAVQKNKALGKDMAI